MKKGGFICLKKAASSEHGYGRSAEWLSGNFMASDQNTSCPLTTLYLYLTEQCNLSCTHCWISPGFSLDRQRGISLDAIKKSIAEAKTLGLQTVKLTGGEPLLYEKFKEHLKFFANKRGSHPLTSFVIESIGRLFLSQRSFFA